MFILRSLLLYNIESMYAMEYKEFLNFVMNGNVMDSQRSRLLGLGRL